LDLLVRCSEKVKHVLPDVGLMVMNPMVHKWGFPKMVVPNNHGFSH